MTDKLKVYICCGCPGSGKTTYAKTFTEMHPDVVRLCPDEFRAKFGWGEGDQSVSYIAFKATYEEMDKALSNGKHVIIDATNMYRKARKEFLKIAKRHDAQTIALVFEVKKETLLERNKKRGEAGGRNVPEDVIDLMLERYECPGTDEFDKVTMMCYIET